jgi:hypothetical protein
MSAGIEITVGEHTAKIYEITNRGKPAFQVSFYKAGERQRLTFNKLAKAKAEARIELSKLVSVNPEVQQLATPDMEALVLARRHLVGTDVPVHVATETFAAAVKLLGNGTQAGSATIIEACRFYLKHGVQKVTKMPLSVCGEEFIKSRRESDSCKDYENQCRVALRALLASLPAGCTELADTKALKDWMVQRYPHAGTRNTNLRVLKTFARWLVVSKYAEGKARCYLHTRRTTGVIEEGFQGDTHVHRNCRFRWVTASGNISLGLEGSESGEGVHHSCSR